jgi:predicted cupin superfamily sugar epimerase
MTDSKKDAKWWIDNLLLARHPEGGYYRETYRSGDIIARDGLPERFGSDRSCSTAIYFLLETGDFSSFHRIKADEIWHYYLGDPVNIHMIDSDGEHKILKLGPDPEAGETFQLVIPGGLWFAAQSDGPEGFSLVGCTVSPGFDFNDFELGSADELSRIYPGHIALIERFTRH